jgi:hypothetical protein
MNHKTVLTLVSIQLISMLLNIDLNANPQRMLGEDGVYFWSESNLQMEPLYPIAGGERLMMLWSEQLAESGRRVNYMQIIDPDSKTGGNQPIVLNNPEMPTRGLRSASDRKGNIFVAWEEKVQDDSTESSTIIQKYDPDGNLRWGDSGINISLEFSKNSYSSDLYPDELGGLYLKNKNHIIALNENGDLRDDWLWQENDLTTSDNDSASQSNSYSVIDRIYIDNKGGFWYSCMPAVTNWTEVSKFNHVTYKGDILWKEPNRFVDEDYTANKYGRERNFQLLVDNGMLYTFSNKEQYSRMVISSEEVNEDLGAGIFMVDNNGVSKGDNYIHKICKTDNYFRLHKLLDGNVLILYCDYFIESTELWATIYDPINNSFPWKKKGKLVCNWKNKVNNDKLPEITTKELGVTQSSNGDIIIPVDLSSKSEGERYWSEIYRISLKGKRKWRKPIVIEHYKQEKVQKEDLVSSHPMIRTDIRYQTFAFPAPKKGFWLANYIIDDREDSFIDISIYNKKGKRQKSELNTPIFDIRNSIKPCIVWKDDEDNHRILFSQQKRGFTLQTLDQEGIIIGNPNGELIVPLSAESPLVSAVRVENQVLIAWIADPYGKKKSDHVPKLSALDLSGRLEWTIELCDLLKVYKNTNIEIVAAPDNKHVAITLIDSESDHPIIFWIDISIGELVWQKDLFSDGIRHGDSYDNGRSACDILINKEDVYVVFWSRWNELIIQRFDHSGNILWEEPYRRQEGRDDGLVGAAFRKPLGIYVVKQKGNIDVTYSWARNITPDGTRGSHSAYPYETTSKHESSGGHEKLFTLIPGSENLWIVPTVNRDLGIQCLDHYSTRIMGGLGRIPKSFESIRYDFNGDSMQAFSDGSDGMWAVWGSIPEVLHLEYENKIVTGWSDIGLMVFKNIRGISSYQSFPLSNHYFAVTVNTYDYNQSARNYYFQILNDD